ncbi:MAG TPA: SGNH/GDSL hydrolase family protein [Planctomycetaceae bacterium]|nr:SGNH/GDSL hydrolase family protein [Planctomycetaceae bacterium]
MTADPLQPSASPPPVRPRRFRSKRARLGLAVGSLVLSLAVAEAVFRLAGIRGQYDPPRADAAVPGPDGIIERVPYGFVPGATVVTRYGSDPRGYFGPHCLIAHEFNAAGWRDREHDLAKAPDTYRILGLGDSYLYGQGVRQADVCLARLETLLQDAVPDRRIECINTGMSGFNTADERDLLVHRGLAYEPDLVIVHFVLNDVEPDVYRPGPKVEFYSEYVGIYQQPDALSRWSYLWSWARQRYLRHVEARRYIRACVASFSEDSPKWAQCRDALNDIQRICAAADVPLLVVIFPFFVDLDGEYPFEPVHEVVRRHCESQAIPVLDLHGAYREYHGPELWVHPTDQHPNEIAHRIAAESIAAFVLSRAESFALR